MVGGGVPCPARTRPFSPKSLRRMSPRSSTWRVRPAPPIAWSSGLSWPCCWQPNRTSPVPSRPSSWASIPTGCATGASAGLARASRWRPWPTGRALGARRFFPPLVEATATAVACELPAQRGQPLSRSSLADIQQVVQQEASVGRISRSTLCRWLRRRALKPWRFRSWIFPRAPDFAVKAARVLDLYAGWWEGAPLEPDEYVLSADEKTSIQARRRCHPSYPAQAAQPQRVEFEYERMGAVQYLAAWDVQRGLVFGRCEAQTGIAPFGRLVRQVMEQEPYRSARRVFWLVDNGSSHRGAAAAQRLAAEFPNLILVHLP